jgi:hypothetical protein
MGRIVTTVTFLSFQALCSLLRRDASVNFKAKGNSLVSVLACNLLMAAYEEDENWPEIFVKVSPLQGLRAERRGKVGAGEGREWRLPVSCPSFKGFDEGLLHAHSGDPSSLRQGPNLIHRRYTLKTRWASGSG